MGECQAGLEMGKRGDSRRRRLRLDRRSVRNPGSPRICQQLGRDRDGAPGHLRNEHREPRRAPGACWTPCVRRGRAASLQRTLRL